MTRAGTARTLLVAAALFGAAAFAQESASPWRVRTIQGETWDGAISIRDGLLTCTDQDGADRSAAVSALLSVEFRGRKGTRGRRRVGRLWLRSGVDFPVSTVAGKGKSLAVTSSEFDGSPVFQSLHVRALRIPRTEVLDDTRFQQALRDPNDAQDYLFALQNGETVRLKVTVRAITEDGLVVEYNGEERPALLLENVYGIVFGKATGLAPDPLPKPRVDVHLKNGERFSGQVSSMDSGHVALDLDEGVQLRLHTKRVSLIEFTSDKLVWLGSMTPSAVEQVPAFDRTWPWMVDRSPGGPGIQLGGTEYHRGLVLIPKTRLEFNLAGKFDTFETTLGIDDRAGPQAHAVFRVYADEKMVFESEPKSLGMPPEVLKIPIAQVERLAIEVDFGKNFDLGDHCAFADARVTKK